MGGDTGVYRVLVGKTEGRGPLGRLRRKWVDNIRMNLHEVLMWDNGLSALTQNRDSWRTLLSAVMNLRVP